jgi:uncharacterized protein (TIGR03435 family)
MSSGAGLFKGKVGLPDLALFLGNVTDRKVIDKTGLHGAFDIKLTWAPSGSGPDSEPAGPSLFVALQEQLGLHLTPGKAPANVMVIDHAEKPMGN